MIPIATFVITKAFDLAPNCVLDLLFGKEEPYEYTGSTTPE